MANNPSVTLTFAGDSKQVSRAADDGGDAIDRFKERIERDSAAMMLATERSAAGQAAAMGRQRREYDRTAESFEDMVNRLTRERRRLDKLNKDADALGLKEHPVFGMVFVKKPAESAGEDAGSSFVDGFSKRVPQGLKSFFSSPGAIVGISALPGLFGPVGLLAGGGLVLGFGAALSGLGLAVAAQAPEVVQHFEKLKNDIVWVMGKISAPFKQTLIDIGNDARSVFDTFAPELEKAFPQAAKDISEFMANLTNAFKELAPVIGPIMDAFGKILDSLGPKLPQVFQDIANALIPLADAVGRNSEGFATMIVWMLSLVAVAINVIAKMIEFGEWWGQVWRDAGATIAKTARDINAWIQSIVDFASRAAEWIGGIFGRMREAMVQRFREMLQGVRDWPATVKAAVGDLGRILWDAGASLIQGLINGIKSKIGEVMSTLKQLTATMPMWKGPEDVDAKLLTKNGRLIIDSLVTGFKDEEPSIHSYLDELTRFLGGFGAGGEMPLAQPVQGSAGSAGGSQVLEVRSDGSPVGDLIVSLIQPTIDARGGNVQLVLGRGRL